MVTPPSSESSESCRTLRWLIRSLWDFRGATKHHVTKLAAAAEAAATAKRSHKSTSMAHGRAKMFGQELAAGATTGAVPDRALGAFANKGFGVHAQTEPRATTAAQSQGRGSRRRFRNLPLAYNRRRQGSAHRVARRKDRQQHGTEGRNVGVGSKGHCTHQVCVLGSRGSDLGPHVLGMMQRHRCGGLSTHHETPELKRRSVHQRAGRSRSAQGAPG